MTTSNQKERFQTKIAMLEQNNQVLRNKCEQYLGELKLVREVCDKDMEHITGLNNMIESWYKLLQSDKDTSTKYAILKSAISAYVENKGGDNE